MPMQVILQDNIENLGKVGDIVKVKPGYARNFLIPRGLAAEASTRNVSQLAHQKRAADAKKGKIKEDAEKLAKAFESAKLVLPRQVGEEDKLFGSVTTMDIEAGLRALGFVIDRKAIQLGEPIKTLGLHEVVVKIHPEVTAKVRVNVTKANTPA